MANKQKRLIVVITRKPNWHYKLFSWRFSKGWDVIVNPRVKALGELLGAYEHTTGVFDLTTLNNYFMGPDFFDDNLILEGNPLKLRTYQEAWAHLTYDIYKELGHEDGQGYVATGR